MDEAESNISYCRTLAAGMSALPRHKCALTQTVRIKLYLRKESCMILAVFS